MTPRTRSLWQILLIIILGLVVYYNSLHNRFIWDDRLHIIDDAFIKSRSDLSKIFSQNMAAGAGYKTPFYRPLQVLSYKIDYSFWGLNATGYHLTSLIVHICVAGAVYLLIYLLSKNQTVSFVAGLLFVAHPLNVETVAFISDRADCLVALFMLLCVIFYIKYLYIEKPGAYILIGSSYTLALLSKESSVVLPLLLLSYHYVFKKRIDGKKFLTISGLILIYIIFRLAVIKSDFLALWQPDSPAQRIPGFFAAVTDYLRIVWLPLGLHMEYSYRMFHWGEFKVVAGVILFLLLLAYAVTKKDKDRFTAFCICWFFIMLLPSSNIYPKIGASYMAERWLYIPSIGLLSLLAGKWGLLYDSKRLRGFSVLMLVGTIGFYSVLTIKQNGYWKDPLTFCARTLVYNPQSMKIYNEMGDAYENLGRNEEAIAAYKKAIQCCPACVGAYFNLVKLYRSLGKNEEAMIVYKKAREINAKNIEHYYETGRQYEAAGKYREAIASYLSARELIK